MNIHDHEVFYLRNAHRTRNIYTYFRRSWWDWNGYLLTLVWDLIWVSWEGSYPAVMVLYYTHIYVYVHTNGACRWSLFIYIAISMDKMSQMFGLIRTRRANTRGQNEVFGRKYTITWLLDMALSIARQGLANQNSVITCVGIYIYIWYVYIYIYDIYIYDIHIYIYIYDI